MPVWDFHLSSSLLSAEERQELATTITKLYVGFGLPPFYVHVRFSEHEGTYDFHGGEPGRKFAFLRIGHVARQFTGDEQKQRFLGSVDKILNPLMKSKGADWEYWVEEVDWNLWRINGMTPPKPNSELEKKWKELNRPAEPEEKL